MLATMKNEYNKLSDIERFITDGRLTEPSNGKRFEWRAMISVSPAQQQSLYS